MLKRNLIRAAIGSALLSTCAAASAGVLPFSGSLTGLAAAGPDSNCAPLPVGGSVSAGTTIGISSLGAFSYTHDICFNPAGGPFQGIFLIDFGADAFSGTLGGSDSPDVTPGVFDVQWTYTILAGTGRFANSSGTFTGTGTVDPRVFPAPLALSFAGLISAPSVPEPRSWAMMLVGFAAVGIAIRRRSANGRALDTVS